PTRCIVSAATWRAALVRDATRASVIDGSPLYGPVPAGHGGAWPTSCHLAVLSPPLAPAQRASVVGSPGCRYRGEAAPRPAPRVALRSLVCHRCPARPNVRPMLVRGRCASGSHGR